MSRRVALIGGNGFLGRGLSLELSANYEVVSFDLPIDISEVVDRGLVLQDFAFVINLSTVANRSSKRVSQYGESWRVNLLELERLANQLNENHIPFIHLSTREIFGMPFNSENTFESEGVLRPTMLIDENYPKNPNNEYAMLKLVSEWILTGRPDTWVVRLSTPYTDEIGQFGSLIPSLIDKALRSAPIELGSYGKQFRDPLHVRDLAAGFVKIIETRPDFPALNFGFPDQNLISLVEIVTFLGSQDIKYSPGEDYGFAFSIDLARSIGWEPRIEIWDFLRTHIG